MILDSASVQVPEYKTDNFSGKTSKYCVLIPVINEGERIKSELKRIKQMNFAIDIIIADGGSTDESLNPQFLKTHGVRTLLTKIGPGKLSAQLRMGLYHALKDGYEGIILIDGNNKDNPAAIPQFVKYLDVGFDHIQGSRFIKGGVAKNTPLSRLLGIKLLHAPLISLASGFRYTDTTNGFRAYSKKFLKDSRVAPFRDVFSQYELHYYLAIRAARLKFKVIEIPVERIYPKGEKVPTKISKVSGNLLVLKTLFKSCLHHFNPEKS